MDMKLGFDPRFQGKNWEEIEPRLKEDYASWSRQQGYSSSTWDQMRDNVRESWEYSPTRARSR